MKQVKSLSIFTFFSFNVFRLKVAQPQKSLLPLCALLFSSIAAAGECKLTFKPDMAAPTTPELTQEFIDQNTVGNAEPAPLANVLTFLENYNGENPAPEIVPANSIEQCVTKVPFALNIFGNRMRQEMRRQFNINLNQTYFYFLMTSGYYTPGPGLSQTSVPRNESNRYEQSP